MSQSEALKARHEQVAYVIPSYKRHTTIKQKTIKLLEDYNIDKKQIYIFVANDAEAILYKEALPEYTNIIVGVLGLANQRNFIVDYFKPKKMIVSLDDDIAKFYTTDKDKKKTIIIEDIKPFITQAFRDCKKYGSFIWSINNTDNPYFFTNQTSFDLRLLYGGLYGFINRHSNDLKIECDHKEDYERTIKYFIKDNIILKYCNYGLYTKCYKGEGGMNTNKFRKEDNDTRVEELLKKYPNYLVIKKCKSPYKELRIINKKGKYNPVKQLPKIERTLFIENLIDKLDDTQFIVNRDRDTAGYGFTMTFGKHRIRRVKGLHDCKNNIKYNELYKMLLEYGTQYVPKDIIWNSIQCNKDYASNPHKDLNNKGESYIIGLGNYKGGATTINGNKYDICFKPTIFNAKIWEHSNELSSNDKARYSICFFNMG